MISKRALAFGLSLAMTTLGVGAVFAQDADTIGRMASADEITKVNETLAKIGLQSRGGREGKAPRFFEVDDAACEIGQYDHQAQTPNTRSG